MVRTPAFLEGVRVLDVTGALAGPYCTSILADLGADVIKIEALEGDPMRRRRGGPHQIAYPFEMVHHDKRSLAVDIRDPEGRDIVKRLAASVDVLVENFRPGVLVRHGLGPELLRAEYPALIYCSISGFGQTGPRGRDGGVDLVAQARSGLMSVTGEPVGPPVKAGYPVSDVGAGMWAAIGILAALRRRTITGTGSTLDVALTDGVLAWGVWETAEYQMTGRNPEPLGTAHRLTAPYQGFQCSDGRWLVLAGIPNRWKQLCDALGRPDLADDPRFEDESSRYINRSDLEEILSDIIARDRVDSWLHRLAEGGIPSGPIQTIAEAMQDEQFVARDMWRQVLVGDHRATVLNTPIRSDGSPGPRASAPRVGEHTSAILFEIGLDGQAVATLVERGVVAGVDLGSPEPS